MFQFLPPEILLHILSYCTDINNTTNSMPLKNQIELMTNFQSLSKSINSNITMIKYFTDFWIQVAPRCLLSGQKVHDEKVLKLISNLKNDHKRKILLARHIKYLMFRERVNHQKDLELNFTILGDGGVGKSSIVVRYVVGQFVEEYDPTIEDAFRKKVEFAGSVINLDILDTAGQEEHGPNLGREQAMRRGDCFIIVASIDSKRNSIREMRELCAQTVRVKDRTDFPIIFAINKIDLVNQTEIDVVPYFRNEIKSIIKDWELTNTSIIECSAKTSHNINMLFEECISRKYCKDIEYLDIIENVIKYDSKYLKKMNKTQKDNCFLH